MRSSLAPAIRVLHSVPRDNWYRGYIMVLTFLIYTSYHLSRKPISVVKSQLNRNCSALPNPPANLSENDTTWCDWAPFDQPNYKELLGSLDTSFLVAYAIGMFFSGIFGERLPLRYYLSGGMVLCGVFTALLGLGYYWEVHGLWYYILFQTLNGLVQTTGWPSVVSCMGNWFGKGKRGFIMGIWNSHTAVGNILGSLIAGVFVSTAWGLSFIVPGIIIGSLGVVCFFFLIEYPEDIGCSPPIQNAGEKDDLENIQVMNSSTENIFTNQAGDTMEDPGIPQETIEHPQAISFWGALKIPGVVEFSLCLLFAKLVSYTFLYWLPLYISKVAHFDPQKAGDMSTLFDAGGIIGGILAGAISDLINGRAVTCCVMLILTAPMLFIYNHFGQTDLSVTIAMLIICGMLVNGPYSLITTAVSADLGTHESLHGNAKALSTVTAIIDGSGSIGAALGPALASVLSSHSWNYVFYMLITSDLLACVFLLRLVYKEIKEMCSCCRKARGFRMM
ncbi:glucose-6-phosphate exchanger SLC37A2 isoform X2 [Pseudophryne corroboree]|uniref:glucose-6-phosphate exchanger SLC37A2 isoform X2 n=1 Tax=Pseudophryne corroboree TaxID=495146 RepID=UPI003081D53A